MTDFDMEVDVDVGSLQDLAERIEETTLSDGCPQCGGDEVEVDIWTGRFESAEIPVGIELECECGWSYDAEAGVEVSVSPEDE